MNGIAPGGSPHRSLTYETLSKHDDHCGPRPRCGFVEGGVIPRQTPCGLTSSGYLSRSIGVAVMVRQTVTSAIWRIFAKSFDRGR